MTVSWLERSDLLKLVERDVSIRGSQSPREVLMSSPVELVAVPAPSTPALDLHTYRVRLARWQAGEEPDVVGLVDFVRFLEEQSAPACAVSVSGHDTACAFVLDDLATRVLAALAVDRAAHRSAADGCQL